MSDKAQTRLSLLKAWVQLGLSLWQTRGNLRILRKRAAVLQTLLQEAPSKFPSVKPELLAKLAEVSAALSTGTIPAVQRRYREHVFQLFRLAPRLLFKPTKPSIPPDAAFFLLDLFLSKADREAIPGDMEEHFRSVLTKYGPIRAYVWFWVETARTIAFRNPICRWLLVRGLMRLAEWLFRYFGG